MELPRGVQRGARNSGEHHRRKRHGKVCVFRQVPLTAPGRAERRGLARLGKVCPGSCQPPPCPSLPLHAPGRTPYTQQAGWGVCQQQGSVSGRPSSQGGIEGESKRVLEPLRLGQNHLERRAGALRLGLPGQRNQFICSQVLASVLRGGASRLEYINPVIWVNKILIP